MANVRYMIDKYSGRGTKFLSILKKDEDTGKIYLRSYRESNGKPYCDEKGNAWRDGSLFDKAFFDLDDEFIRISNDEAEALIKEQDENGIVNWAYDGLWRACENRETLEEYEKRMGW